MILNNYMIKDNEDIKLNQYNLIIATSLWFWIYNDLGMIHTAQHGSSVYTHQSLSFDAKAIKEIRLKIYLSYYSIKTMSNEFFYHYIPFLMAKMDWILKKGG